MNNITYIYVNEKGEVVGLTKEKLEQLFKDEYNRGYRDGYSTGAYTIQTTPATITDKTWRDIYYTTGTPPVNHPVITCSDSSAMNYNTTVEHSNGSIVYTSSSNDPTYGIGTNMND